MRTNLHGDKCASADESGHLSDLAKGGSSVCIFQMQGCRRLINMADNKTFKYVQFHLGYSFQGWFQLGYSSQGGRLMREQWPVQ